MTRVCVFCASGPVPEEDIRLAEELGHAIGKRGWTLVSGGGRVSMMGAVTRGARAEGGFTVGVIPQSLYDREVADTQSGELLVVESMRQRKLEMDLRADAFIILPGGIGTLEEFFEVWTSKYLNLHHRPVVMLDPRGHFAGLFAWLEEVSTHGFVSPRALAEIERVGSIEEALALLSPGLSEALPGGETLGF